MPLNLGIYPVLSILMIDFIRKSRFNILWVTIFSLFTTLAEYSAVLLGKAKYYNGWNNIKTFFSYFIPYYLVYKYNQWTNKI